MKRGGGGTNLLHNGHATHTCTLTHTAIVSFPVMGKQTRQSSMCDNIPLCRTHTDTHTHTHTHTHKGGGEKLAPLMQEIEKEG